MIKIKTQKEIEIIGEGGKILSSIMKTLEEMIKPGVATIDLDRAAEALILSSGGKPGFKGYQGFNYSLCVSVNENIVHGLPSNYVLKQGDIVGLDSGMLYKGFYSDMAITVGVGQISSEAKKLINATKKSLELAINKTKIGNTVGDIGSLVQSFIEKQGLGVIKDLCGHGIGKDLHEDPKIPNFGKPGTGEILKEGMVICIEPMVTSGSYKLRKSDDGYGYATKDNSLTAHFEHTIAVTSKGPRILTK